MFEGRSTSNVKPTINGEMNAPARTTVLLVDDDPTVRKSLTRMVSAAGYVVQAFATGGEFLRHQMPSGPTCVLLDMQMEGMTGAEVLLGAGAGAGVAGA